jgi:hypothetical protein
MTKGLKASLPEIECNQTVMGLPPLTSAVFLIAKYIYTTHDVINVLFNRMLLLSPYYA